MICGGAARRPGAIHRARAPAMCSTAMFETTNPRGVRLRGPARTESVREGLAAPRSARGRLLVQRLVHLGDERRQTIDGTVRALDDLRVLSDEARLEQVQTEA